MNAISQELLLILAPVASALACVIAKLTYKETIAKIANLDSITYNLLTRMGVIPVNVTNSVLTWQETFVTRIVENVNVFLQQLVSLMQNNCIYSRTLLRVRQDLFAFSEILINRVRTNEALLYILLSPCI